jgi:CTP:molybdopterin cytidylyltransferase MocA
MVVVLAAGASVRLGEAKQMVHIGGEPLLRRTCRRALAADVGPVAVVLGGDAVRHRRLIDDLPVHVAVNDEWQEGIAASLRHAVGIAAARDAASLIVLCDQYRVTSRDIRRLHRSWRREPSRPCVSISAGYAGPPAIFPLDMYDAIRGLRGDIGARALLDRGTQPPVAIANPRAAYDLDSQDDLRRALSARRGASTMAR